MELEMMVKLMLAVVFGGIIGYTREVGGKSAGFRTHILVCVGSALFTIASIYMGTAFNNVDPSRIASSIVVGIGFLGAGTIFKTAESVKGLTTAASIWMCAAIGLALGCGMYNISAFATVLAFLVIGVLSRFEEKFMRGKR